jgi:hypothetical protein
MKERAKKNDNGKACVASRHGWLYGLMENINNTPEEDT